VPHIILNWFNDKDHEIIVKDLTDRSFAFHYKKEFQDWPSRAQETLELCKSHHGCYANFTDGSGIQIGCNGVKYVVAS